MIDDRKGMFKMLDIYKFMEECKAYGLSSDEARCEYSKALGEEQQTREENYWNDPIIMDGYRQQDVIDMYRRER